MVGWFAVDGDLYHRPVEQAADGWAEDAARWGQLRPVAEHLARYFWELWYGSGHWQVLRDERYSYGVFGRSWPARQAGWGWTVRHANAPADPARGRPYPGQPLPANRLVESFLGGRRLRCPTRPGLRPGDFRFSRVFAYLPEARDQVDFLHLDIDYPDVTELARFKRLVKDAPEQITAAQWQEAEQHPFLVTDRFYLTGHQGVLCVPSRSSGMHAWILFAEPVPTITARRLAERLNRELRGTVESTNVGRLSVDGWRPVAGVMPFPTAYPHRHPPSAELPSWVARMVRPGPTFTLQQADLGQLLPEAVGPPLPTTGGSVVTTATQTAVGTAEPVDELADWYATARLVLLDAKRRMLCGRRAVGEIQCDATVISWGSYIRSGHFARRVHPAGLLWSTIPTHDLAPTMLAELPLGLIPDGCFNDWLVAGLAHFHPWWLVASVSPPAKLDDRCRRYKACTSGRAPARRLLGLARVISDRFVYEVVGDVETCAKRAAKQDALYLLASFALLEANLREGHEIILPVGHVRRVLGRDGDAASLHHRFRQPVMQLYFQVASEGRVPALRRQTWPLQILVPNQRGLELLSYLATPPHRSVLRYVARERSAAPAIGDEPSVLEHALAESENTAWLKSVGSRPGEAAAN